MDEASVQFDICVSFSDLTVIVGWQKRHSACEHIMPLVPTGSLPDQVEENQGGSS